MRAQNFPPRSKRARKLYEYPPHLDIECAYPACPLVFHNLDYKSYSNHLLSHLTEMAARVERLNRQMGMGLKI